jgi:putative membrane protein
MKTFPVIGFALLLAACGANETADNSDDMAAPVTATDTATDTNSMADKTAMPAAPTDAAGYMAIAGAGDMWEIESSKAFMAKSDDADLKKFAQMMVDHHTQSTEKVKAAAKSASLTAPAPKLDAWQQRMLDEIKAADAAGVDAVYMRHQQAAHQKALALHQGYAANGDNEALKKAASEIAPVVQKHIAELGRMSSAS